MFTHFNEGVVRRDKIKMSNHQVLCGGDIENIVKCHFPLNFNKFGVKQLERQFNF
jgi:hypothetical protein